MLRRTGMALLVGLALSGHGATVGGAAAPAEGPPTDTFTPLVVSPPAPHTAPVLGTDGKYHVVCELMLVDAQAPPAPLARLAVLDARDRARALAPSQGTVA